MHAIISLLDEKHTRLALALADELDEQFGVRAVAQAVRYPHFSWQGAERYDLDSLETTLRAIARETEPFRVYADGLGVFTGAYPVLYVAVARNPDLTRLHERLWRELAAVSEDPSPHYSPERLLTHITLAQWDISANNLGEIVGYLCERPLEWDIAIDNLALLYQEQPGARGEVRLRIPFGPATEAAADAQGTTVTDDTMDGADADVSRDGATTE